MVTVTLLRRMAARWRATGDAAESGGPCAPPGPLVLPAASGGGRQS
ncbi:MAG: hypothetical protein M3179_08960 [Actinomycetota bacterium]|nr:hypothetical protein [Actinomycetota bacterium]